MHEIDERNDRCTPHSPTSLVQSDWQNFEATPRRRESRTIVAAGDTSSVRGRFTSSRFVGRQTQLAEVALAFREAREGLPRLILISGDSGVGKTRFLAEA